MPVLAGVVLVGLSACAIESGGPGLGQGEPADAAATTEPSPLAGRTLLSTGVTGHDLVDGSTVRMTFEADQLSVNAGCNTMVGGYAVEEGALHISMLAQTEMACEPELMEQDEWLAGFLQDGPALTETADGIVLAGGGVELELTDREVADPDLALEGQTWVLNSALTETAEANISGMENASLVFDAGNVQLRTGCNTGGGSYTLEGDRLTLSPLRLTRMACPGTAMEVEQAMVSVLDQSDLTVAVEGATLTLTAPDGTALGFVAGTSETETVTEPGGAGDSETSTTAPGSDAEATTAP